MNDYSFSNFQEFFEYQLKKHHHSADGTKLFTLNDLSKKLGYKSSSLLSMIATGKRLPSSEVLVSLFEEWEIDHNQREIIRLRLEIEKRTRKNQPTIALMERLLKVDKKSKYKTIDLDSFNSIRDWYNVVLQMMVSTPAFREDYTYIGQVLKRKVTPTQIRKGFETLINVGMLQRNPETGALEPVTNDCSSETSHDIPSEAIREHHKGMITRALESIDEQDVEERHINGLTLKFNKQNKAEAKKFILNFVKDFNEKFHDNDSNNIHQLNVQFFAHTKDQTL